MTKKIAVINDLSGFGRCSLTAAISVISAMGIQACPLPTAILTAQTGYPHYYLDDYTDKMDIYRQEWQKMGQHFDGIYTGFVASEAQIDQIFHFIDTFYTSDTFLLVDPVMGDDGIKYDMFTPKLLEKMNALVGEADIITPNLTELCLLTDADYDAIIDIADTRILIDVIGELASTLLPPDSDNSNTLDSRQTSKKEKEIIVIPTKTVPQGITAIINFMPDADAKTNEEAMLEEIKNVKTGQVTYAVRDTRLDEKEIHEGDIMGIGDHGILAVGKGRENVAKEMVAAMVDEDSEVISIYYGAETTEEDAESLAAELEEAYPDCEVEVNMGGQPIYYYIISVE